MRRILLTALFLLSGLGLAPASAEDRDPSPVEQMAYLHWLTGHWRNEHLEAHYSAPEGGEILSWTKQYKEGRVRFFEFERFAVIEGHLTLIPYPGGKRSKHDFPMAELDPIAQRVLFVNPEHDWPTHLEYHRETEDRLRIRVWGPGNDGQDAVLEYVLERVED